MNLSEIGLPDQIFTRNILHVFNLNQSIAGMGAGVRDDNTAFQLTYFNMTISHTMQWIKEVVPAAHNMDAISRGVQQFYKETSYYARPDVNQNGVVGYAMLIMLLGECSQKVMESISKPYTELECMKLFYGHMIAILGICMEWKNRIKPKEGGGNA